MISGMFIAPNVSTEEDAAKTHEDNKDIRNIDLIFIPCFRMMIYSGKDLSGVGSVSINAITDIAAKSKSEIEIKGSMMFGIA